MIWSLYLSTFPLLSYLIQNMGFRVIGVTPIGIGTVSYTWFELRDSSSSLSVDFHMSESGLLKASFSDLGRLSFEGLVLAMPVKKASLSSIVSMWKAPGISSWVS